MTSSPSPAPLAEGRDKRNNHKLGPDIDGKVTNAQWQSYASLSYLTNKLTNWTGLSSSRTVSGSVKSASTLATAPAISVLACCSNGTSTENPLKRTNKESNSEEGAICLMRLTSSSKSTSDFKNLTKGDGVIRLGQQK